MQRKYVKQISQIQILNQLSSQEESTDDFEFNEIPANVFAQDLQKLMLRLRGENISKNGRFVQYAKLHESELYKDYKKKAMALNFINLSGLSENQKKAFFINIYNALTIHGLTECDKLPSSPLDLNQFWKVTSYCIGRETYSLDDIEHGILRCNRPHPVAVERPFGESDSRLKYVCKEFDPRIHFALNCGAFSCPPINVYNENNLEDALTLATKSFCELEVKVIGKDLVLSQLFQWYRSDFGSTEVEAIRWILAYLSEESASPIKDLLFCLERIGGISIRYQPYNWNLNNLDVTDMD
ncbi:DgyrCDS12173 [Dimorphilus gyrociliatus]|uniref:DgyrCDS12173 n=1 Tax=Dimorphilus gyrociliatus TaxID=2664684 RepID=A0A7I8W5P6_9ANNE|nr:DgyrCDS12173 [Dimorphilus gyrociliatus]